MSSAKFFNLLYNLQGKFVDNNKYVTEEQLESRLKEFMKNLKTNEKGVLTNEPTSRNDE